MKKLIMNNRIFLIIICSSLAIVAGVGGARSDSGNEGSNNKMNKSMSSLGFIQTILLQEPSFKYLT